jgi:hypothetical protein
MTSQCLWQWNFVRNVPIYKRTNANDPRMSLKGLGRGIQFEAGHDYFQQL